MDFNLPEEIQILRDTVRRFVDKELIPLEREYRHDSEGPMPERLLKPLQEKAKSMGLWMLDVPAEYGGAGLGLLPRCIIHEEIARAASLPFRGLELFGPEVRPVLFHCNEEQKERFLKPVLRGEVRFCFAQTEPDAGSDPADMRTRAVQDGDRFIINGTKRFITAAGRSDYVQLMALTDPEKRARGGITCFAVDLKSPGVALERQWPTMMGEAPWQILFENVRVPAANVIGKVGGGFSLAQKWISEGRIRGHGARPVGIAQRALDMMIEYSKVRVTFGRPLADRQAIQFMIADSAMELHATRQHGLRMRLARRSRRRRTQSFLHGQDHGHRDGEPRHRPSDPSSRRLGIDERVAPRMVVSPDSQYPNHRRRQRSAALAVGPKPHTSARLGTIKERAKESRIGLA